MTAERCALSGRVVTWIPRDSWASDDETVICIRCGSRVRFRVRAADLPGHARLLPHRTDGRPCR